MADTLFTPITINTLTIPNRVVRSATQDYYAEEDGRITEKERAIYRELAQGGIGLIISGFMYVSADGKCTRGQIAIDRDEVISSLAAFTEEVHAKGGRIAAQIVHGGRQIRPGSIAGEIIAPSPLPIQEGKPAPREMTHNDILRVKDDFVRAALRAKTAGFDAVQFHIAHGYLLSQFLSPHTNKRADEYGGSVENRVRIMRDIVSETRARVGDEYPLLVKLNGTDGGFDDGLTIEDAVTAGRMLAECGIDAIEVSRGMIGSPLPSIVANVSREEDEAYLLPLAKAMKDAVDVPVISVGGYRTKRVMDRAIAASACDMVALSRPFIREPALALRMKDGQERARCTSCNKCHSPRGIACVFADDDAEA